MDRSFLVTLQFDGGGFAGWQRQPDQRTVQGEFEAVLERLSGQRIVAHGAGRTDTGVHAEGLGVSCVMPDGWEAGSLHRALNALLPADCWVAKVCEVRHGFHARKLATSRRYRYEIGTDEACRSPFRRRWEWPLGRPLDVARLSRSAATIHGEHDFHRLSVQRSPRPHYRCRIAHAAWSERPDGTGMRLEIEADRFLHHMVRMLVGTMVEISLGRRPEKDMALLLAHDPAVRTSPPAPAAGLYFVAAAYPAEWFNLGERSR
ncbi:MAG TPA: tRNA pseudouridine(38-40) synthase TruA [Gemmatimonadales bacterium]|nr:tRNA pseudouridine(38-40) synthase TruA [Gemmatimonadales bacterium]